MKKNECGHRKKNCDCGFKFPATLLPNCNGCGHIYTKAQKGRKTCPQCKTARGINPEGADLNCPMCGLDRTCTQPRVKGSTACSMHGGMSKSGSEHGRFSHGRHTKMPERLLERLALANKDAKLFDLRQDVALIDVRIDDLLEQVDVHSSAQLWAIAQAALADFLAIRGMKGKGKAEESALKKLTVALNAGTSDAGAWREIFKLKQDRRKIVTAAIRHKQLLKTHVPSEQVLTAFVAVGRAVRENCSNAKEREKIVQRIKQIVGGDNSEILEAAEAHTFAADESDLASPLKQ